MKPKRIKTRGRSAFDRRGDEPQEPRSSPLHFEAVLTAHDLLKRGNVVPVERLMTELGTSKRTVQRLMLYMRDRLGADVSFDHDAGGYRYMGEQRVRLPEVPLTEGDLFALYVASPILAQYRETPLGERFEQSFRKITGLLPMPILKRLSIVPERIEAKARVPSEAEAERFATVLNALKQNRQLKIRYYSAYRDTHELRCVDPYVLCVVGTRWYLLAHDHKRDRVLSFAVDRIWSAAETGKEFQRPPGFSADTHLADAFGIYQSPIEEGQEPTEIRIWFDAFASNYIRETRWHSSQTITLSRDDGIELTIRVRGTVEVERFVLAWGEHAEVLAPASLRAAVRDRLTRTLARYGAAE